MKKKWTDGERELLTDVYNEMEREDMLKLFPDRGWGSITKMAQVMGIARRYKNPNILLSNYKVPNKYIFKEDYIEMLVYNKNSGTYIAKISIEDYDLVKKYTWKTKKDGKLMYVRATYRPERFISKEIMLHRLISNPEVGLVVDHINGDPLDNRRENLRNVTSKVNSQNIRNVKNNSTGIIGITIVNLKSGNHYIKKYKVAVQMDNKKVFRKEYPFTEDGFNSAKIDNFFARAYCFSHNPEYKNIKTEDIPQWIKDRIDKCAKSNKLHISKKVAFRLSILDRDNYTCKGCSKYFNPEDASDLHIHHILEKSEFKSLEFDNNNVICLCRECHESIKKREKDASKTFSLILKREGKIA